MKWDNNIREFDSYRVFYGGRPSFFHDKENSTLDLNLFLGSRGDDRLLPTRKKAERHYEQVGQLHNERPDYAFEYMKDCQTKVNIRLEQQQILAKSLDAIDLFQVKKAF